MTPTYSAFGSFHDERAAATSTLRKAAALASGGTLPSSVFLPASLAVDIPQDDVMARFTIIAAPITATLQPSQSTAVAYDDAQGLSTEIFVPAGAVTTTALLKITPTLSHGETDSVFAGHAFLMEANAGQVPINQFLQPISLTISYSDLDIRLVASEEELWLRWSDGITYFDAKDSCSPASSYHRDINSNVISLQVCLGGEYTLLGPSYRVFSPWVADFGS